MKTVLTYKDGRVVTTGLVPSFLPGDPGVDMLDDDQGIVYTVALDELVDINVRLVE